MRKILNILEWVFVGLFSHYIYGKHVYARIN